MSLPRPVHPGTTYMVTRRTTQRQFLLTPCAVVNQVMLYTLAVMAKRWGIDVHAFVCMSTHWHGSFTDVRGTLPWFMRDFMSITARALNAYHGRFENFWSNEKYSRVELPGWAEQLENLVYIHTNPVTAGLVEKHEDWPGAATSPCSKGAYEIEVERPEHFFAEDSKTMPKRVRLRVTPPPLLRAEMKPREIGQTLVARIKEKESETRKRMRREGRKFVGRKNILRQSPRSCARSREQRFKTNPRIACRDKLRRIELLQLLDEWNRQHRFAFEKQRDGDRFAVFPRGSLFWPQVGGSLVAGGESKPRPPPRRPEPG